MNYLFIDLEFSNSYQRQSKICEFGYILTDNNFNIIKDEDILINPGKGGQFQEVHGGDFSYAHKINEYYKQKQYPDFYEKIKKILLDKNSCIIGYSIDSDIDSIMIANKRYGQEPYHLRGFDVQRMLEEYKEDKKTQVSLEKAVFIYADEAELYGIRAHKPDDDAYMTMLILKKLVILGKTNIETFLKQNEDTIYDSISGYKEEDIENE